jgi:phosphatidate cytidylyltransferase
MKRILTGLLLAAFAAYAIFFAPHPVFVAIVALMACLCYYEYAGIAAASGVEGAMWLGFGGGLLVLLRPDTLLPVALTILAAALLSRDLAKALGFAAATVLGIVYVFGSWSTAIPLRQAGVAWIFYALAINWVGDIAAYYVGRSIGRHKLAPRVSPGKSWEGAVASMLAAVAFGCWYGTQFGLGLGLPLLAVLSAVANVSGQIGDLAESALKRGAGMKDSGTLLPGHGGFLDRLDSTLFTLPVVAYFLSISR